MFIQCLLLFKDTFNQFSFFLLLLQSYDKLICEGKIFLQASNNSIN